MQKIPTVFERSGEGRGTHLLETAKPECQWVLDGEGWPTRKYDGTCVAHLGRGQWVVRREIKPGKPRPDGFIEIGHDPATEKTVGWEPAENSGFQRWLEEAIVNGGEADGGRTPWEYGTYELIGPKINGNPERAERHELIYHADAQRLPEPSGGRTFADLKQFLEVWHEAHGIEGIVWHHPDGRMAKLKVRDFR